MGQLHGLTDSEASADERGQLFFNEAGRKVYISRLFKRLCKLEDAGFIRGHFFLNHNKLFTLAERGHALLKKRGLARLQGYRDSIEDSLVPHELTVNAVGLVMSELLGLTVRTERERFVWPDRGGRAPAPERGISDLWIVDRDQPKAIEVEMGQKSRGRYAEIFDAYRSRLPRGGALLYLTSWPSGVRCMLEHARDFQTPFVYACSIEDFRLSAGRAPFLGAAGGQLRLDKPALAETA